MFLRLVPLSCIQNFCGSGLNVGNKLEDSEREERRPRHTREAEEEKRAVGTSSCNDQGMRAVRTVKNLALGPGLTPYSAPARNLTLDKLYKQHVSPLPHLETWNKKSTYFVGY